MRAILAVIIGYAVWTVLWLGGNAGFRALNILPKDASVHIDWIGPLCAMLVLSVVCSFVAGYIAAMIHRSASTLPVIILGALLLLTGIGVQAGLLHLMPIWYHVIFLVLIIPVVLFGAQSARKGDVGNLDISDL